MDHRPTKLRRNSTLPLLLIATAAGAVDLIPQGVHAQITYISSFGSEGTGPGEFNNPSGIGVGPDGTVYVVDPNDQRAQYFTPTGTYVGVFANSGAGAVGLPNSVVVDDLGTVFISDSSDDHVLTYNSTGAFLGEFGSFGSGNGQFESPYGVSFGPNGNLYVADNGNNRVEQFTSTGAFLSTFGSSGSAPGELNHPYGVAVGPSGTVYVADGLNNRINAYSATGIFQSSFGSSTLNDPDGMAVSATGNIYVADYGENNVEEFNSAGTLLNTIGGSGGVNFLNPTGIAVTPNGSLYVVDAGNSRVDQFFDPSAWVAGANSFTNLLQGPILVQVGPTGILGSSLTLNPLMSLSAYSLTVASGGVLTEAGGTLATSSNNPASFGVAGEFFYQSGAFSAATINVTTGGLFQAIQGGALTVYTSTTVAGQMTLDGGVTMTAPLINVSSGGILSVGNSLITLSGALTNSAGGEVQLNNTNGSIINAASIQNAGTLDGTGRIAATFNNNAGGNLAVNSGQSLTITGASNTNAGTINLGGGALHYTQSLANTATIEGFGTLRVDGGLTNTGGTLALAGSSSVTGTVTSNSASLIHLSGNSPNVFFSSVANSGALTIDAGASGTFYGPYTGGGPITDNGSLYLNATSVAGKISGNGNLTIGSSSSGPASAQLLAGSGGSTLSSLSLSTGSTLDMTNNHLTINYGSAASPEATVRSEIVTGYNNGAWNGPGIDSSAAADSGRTYGLGYADGSVDTGTAAGPGQVLIKYTLYGDANLDGTVNLTDLLSLLNSYGQSGKDWSQGDFNYDGTVNLTDLLELLNNYGLVSTGASISPPSQVPEPCTAGLLFVAGSLVLTSRGKRRS